MGVTNMIRAPEAVTIKEIIDETPTIKTFKFDTDIEANPGEFLMVWNVTDEKPMSISNIGDGELSITVKNIGDFTSKLHELEVGDMIGVRGSYGNGFKTDFKDKKLLVIGGGVGMAPVTALTHKLIENNEVDVLLAATTKDELLFLEEFENLDVNLHPCTDDGSYGFEG